MTQWTDLFETIYTTRAMRRLRPDPVPDELVRSILEAGVAAASGGNRQAWRFLVVKDRAIKEKVQYYYKRAFEEVVSPRFRTSSPPPGASLGSHRRQHEAVVYLTEHYHEAPVWIVACLDNGEETATAVSGASIYPAVQNMLLAARALGLGSTLTTRHLRYQAEVEEILGLPPGFRSYAILPIGYPLGNFGPVKRGPLADVVHLDHWGEPFPGI